MDYISPDASFGFGGLNPDMMINIMRPIVHELGRGAFDRVAFFEIITAAEQVNPNFRDEDEPAYIVATIIAIKKYGLEKEKAIDLLVKKEIVQWCFERFLSEKGGDFTDLYPAETTVKIDDGNSFTFSSAEMSESMKTMLMIPIVAETTDACQSDKNLRRVAHNMMDKLIPYMDQIDPLMDPLYAMVLIQRYHYDFDKSFELAKEHKVIDTAYEEFLKEKGTVIASEAMGEPPTDSIN